MNSDNEIVYLHLDDIIPNRFQPREVFDERALKELAVSIKEHGVIQPIIVRKNNNRYEIIAGERRYKAAALAGLTKIPAIIRNLDDKESSKVALLENLQRRNLNPMEEAKTYQKILELDEMTQSELAKTMGKSQSAVANKLRLLALPEKVQQALMNEQISERHARTLLNLDDPKRQVELLDKIIETRMTVRELEQEIKKDTTSQKELEENIMPNFNLDNDLSSKPVEDIISMSSPNFQKPENEANVNLDSFINQKPIAPQVKMEQDNTKSYGEVTIAPPSELGNNQKEERQLPKFFNYGEINDEEDDDEPEGAPANEKTNSTSIDLNELKANSQDINLNNITPGADLDSLLKVNKQNTNNQEDNIEEDFKFLKPTKIEDNKKDTNVSEKRGDITSYFNSPDLIMSNNTEETINPQKVEDKKINVPELNNNITEFNEDFTTDDDFSNEDADLDGELNLPEVPVEESKKEEAPYINIPESIRDKAALTSILMSDGIKNEQVSKRKPYTIRESINEIRKTIGELEKTGVKVESDEMDFENSYQIVIKIHKDTNDEK